MQYLIKVKRESAAAHLWDGVDTFCHMWTTGGLAKEKQYEVRPTPEGRRICAMCRAVARRPS